ncbi:MAG: hypothetical protein JSU85_15645 [Candidatus Zixiibacteriota bacterium]|nr:MAG: hypothetical protein JSU85_15645 [candidate division Zixibacteria bacterium]
MLKRKLISLFVFISVMGLCITTCDNDTTGSGRNVNNTDFMASESFEYAVGVVDHTRFSLAAINGTVNITGVPGADSVMISGEKSVGSESMEDAEDYLQFLEVTVEDNISGVAVRTEQPANTYGRSYTVDYNITIPRDFIVVATAVNGLIFISTINNNITVQHVNGQISINEIFGSANVTMVNGQIIGDITLPPDGMIDMLTVNGDINLIMPQNTSAEFSAIVANGYINVYNLVLHDQVSTNTSVSGTLGDGQGTISLLVTNGGINVAGN